jgi:hypothetical protein
MCLILDPEKNMAIPGSSGQMIDPHSLVVFLHEASGFGRGPKNLVGEKTKVWKTPSFREQDSLHSLKASHSAEALPGLTADCQTRTNSTPGKPRSRSSGRQR